MGTEGDGSAVYEAHITKSDATHATDWYRYLFVTIPTELRVNICLRNPLLKISRNSSLD
jgi:hypothetical protein